MKIRPVGVDGQTDMTKLTAAFRTLATTPNNHGRYAMETNATPAHIIYTRVGTLIVATIYLQLIQNRYMFRSFTLLQCSHQHCVQPVASDVEVVRYL